MILYIKNQEVEVVPIDLTNITTFMQRKKMINDYEQYLKRKFWQELMLTWEWEIIISTESKMHNHKTEQQCPIV